MSTVCTVPIGIKNFVGIADLKVVKDPEGILCSLPLGVCLAVILYDPVIKAAGMMHSLLPDSRVDRVRAVTNPAIFIDTGMTALLKLLEKVGSKPESLQVYVVGGARLMDDSDVFNLGRKNHEFLIQHLSSLGLKINAEDVGGRTNRSVMIHIGTGEVFIKCTGETDMTSLCKS